MNNRVEKKSLPQCHQMVLWMIREHTINKPVLSRDLEHIYTISGPQVREIVRYYRYVELYPIASGNKGYWLARTLPEWEKTIKNLKSRAISMLDGLNDITKHNFSDQLTIDL